MKKVIGSILGMLLLLLVVKDASASCTQVGSNQTTCTGSQSVECSQSLPTPGRINRYCCDTVADCDTQKEEVQEEISDKLKSEGLTCDSDTGIMTAIGCIHILGEGSTERFLGELLKWAVGIGGGIAFLLIVYASFMIMTSAGNPERLKAGQELLTSAISGLILLVLSVFVLKFIGIDILGLDQFGFGQ
jgi:hypothetical protein